MTAVPRVLTVATVRVSNLGQFRTAMSQEREAQLKGKRPLRQANRQPRDRAFAHDSRKELTCQRPVLTRNEVEPRTAFRRGHVLPLGVRFQGGSARLRGDQSSLLAVRRPNSEVTPGESRGGVDGNRRAAKAETIEKQKRLIRRTNDPRPALNLHPVRKH